MFGRRLVGTYLDAAQGWGAGGCGDRTMIELLVPEVCEEVLLGCIDLHLPAVVENSLIPHMVQGLGGYRV